MIQNYDEIDEIFRTDGYHLASEILGTRINAFSLNFLTGKIYKYIDQLLQSFENRTKQEDNLIACRKSCSWCCSQAVFINPREALYIENFIRANTASGLLRELKEKIRLKHEKTRFMKLSELLNYKHPCPFLSNDICTIYPARPMACRIYLSMDINSCIKFFKNPEGGRNFARLFEFPLHAGRMMNEGVSLWMKNHGFPVHALLLEAGLFRALEEDDPGTLWLEHKNLFSSVAFPEDELKELENLEQKSKNS